jgi:sugar phosphate permease
MRKNREIFWGWFIVAGAFFVMATNYGARYCFGIFLKPMSEEFSLSRSVIALAATINMLVYSFGAVFVGRMLDRIAPRWIMTAGAILATCGYILTGFVNTPAGFYITYGIRRSDDRRGKPQGIDPKELNISLNLSQWH